jgi:isopentenyl diphosphate isomerase/L-lactate dehydrogenase-like FMN-dependent dehydrogenase
MMAMFPNLALTWDDLGWLRERTTLPLVVKGVLRGDDAKRAFAAGADGIVVSNHGGRQVDGAVSSIDALIEVRREVGRDPVILMDSGIRRGADVVKAVAAGANAVFVGRTYIYGLVVGGDGAPAAGRRDRRDARADRFRLCWGARRVVDGASRYRSRLSHVRSTRAGT